MEKISYSPVNKKAYRSPVLTRYEDLRTVTLGSSPIGTESGPGGDFIRVPGSPPQGNRATGGSQDIFDQ